MSALQRRFFFGVIFVLMVSVVVSAVITLVVTATINLIRGTTYDPHDYWGIGYILTTLVLVMREVSRAVFAHDAIVRLHQHFRLSYTDVCDAIFVYKLHKKRPIQEWNREWVRANLELCRTRGDWPF